MKYFQCHKRVLAAKIVNIATVRTDDGQVSTTLHLEGGSFVQPSPEWVAKHVPACGGYLVEYEDGYTSFSPAKAFEAGYAEVTAEDPKTTGLSFGEAIEVMERGGRVARAGWNGKGMWLCLGQGNPALEAEKFWNPHTRAHAEANGGTAEVLPYIIMKTADGKVLMGWLASQSDMLAKDWMVAI